VHERKHASGSGLRGEIAALFDAHGNETCGEGVSIAEHSLQTAALARAESADSALVVAALLHDIGHLIELRDDTFGYHKHDQSGGIWLTARLPAVVSEPVRLHVAAKRYLCTIEPDYFGLLSMPSQYPLSKQGGPMTAAETADFARQPFIDRAVRPRRWDERVKTVAIEVPPLDSYRRAIAMSAE
jgi:[1-hydroxy-2-(trimethylamino)ethyl]phosphonate dioxygenase